jgi:hypothetical protein
MFEIVEAPSLANVFGQHFEQDQHSLQADSQPHDSSL